jgi:tetratricopeptide (TPR) repeat protein
MGALKLNTDEQFAQSLDHINHAIRIDSTMAESYFLAAENYYELGVLQHAKNKKAAIQEFNKTRFYLDKAIELDSLNGENYRLLGEYYIFNERWASAEKALLKSWQLNSNNPRVYPHYARFHKFRYKKIGFQNEEQIYHRALFLNPFYEKAYLLLSDYYLFNNNRVKGIEVLNEYLKLNPNSVPALMALSKVYLVRNKVVQALEFLEKVIKLDPGNTDAFYNLGIVYYNSEDFENAKRFFKRAIEISNHLNSYLYLAYISEQEGNKEDAISYLRKRIHYKTGFDDKFAEEARKHLYKLIHEDSTMGASHD